MLIEHIVFRLIIIGLLVLMFVARQALFDAIFDDASYKAFPVQERQIAITQDQNISLDRNANINFTLKNTG